MSDTTKNVLMLVYGDAQDDPRVRRAGATIAQFGYNVTVIGSARNAVRDNGRTPTHQTTEDMTLILTPIFCSLNPIHVLHILWGLLWGNIGDMTSPPPTDRNSLRTTLNIIIYNLWVLRLGLWQHYDLIHAHEVWALPCGWLLKWRSRAAFIYDAHEYVPGLFSGIRGKIAAKIETLFAPRVDVIITVGERLAKKLEDTFAKPVVVIGNWRGFEEFQINDHDFLKQEQQRLKINNYRLVVSHIALFMKDRYHLPELLQAAAESPDVLVLLAGRGELYPLVEDYAGQYPNIELLGWLPFEKIPIYTHLSDAVQVTLDKKFPQVYFVASNKTFEGLMGGRAIIAQRDVGETGDIVKQYNAGILLDEVTPKTIKAAFDQLKDPQTRQTLQQNALAAREHYHWGIAEQRFKQLYDDLIGAP